MPTPCWWKHLCSIRALVPVSFFLFFSLSFSLSLSGYFFGVQRPSEFTFLPGLLRPSQEGALHLQPIERVPEASVKRASPVPGALLAFCINQGISASFSLLYFLIVNSGPPGSRPIKDLNRYLIEMRNCDVTGTKTGARKRNFWVFLCEACQIFRNSAMM